MDILKISSKSSPNSVAGAIAGLIKENKTVQMQAIGAGAINQAVKSVAVARSFIAPQGLELFCVPSFTSVEIDGSLKTGVKFLVETREAKEEFIL